MHILRDVLLLLGLIWPVVSCCFLLSKLQDRECEQLFAKGLTRIDHLNEMAKAVEASRCSSEFKNMVDRLNSLVSADADQDICGQQKANRVRDFHLAYVEAGAGSAGSACKRQLPKPLRQFFIGYALKLSMTCRRLAIFSLTSEVQRANILTEQDFNRLSVVVDDDNSLLASLTSIPRGTDDLILPQNLIKMMSAQMRKRQAAQWDAENKIYLQSAINKQIADYQMVCERRFRPIYRKVIAPLITLASLGYNFRRPMEGTSEDPSQDGNESEHKLAERWFRIIFMCEFLDDVQVLSGGEHLLPPTSDQRAISSNQAEPEERERSQKQVVRLRVFDKSKAKGLMQRVADSEPERATSNSDQLELAQFEPHGKLYKMRNTVVSRTDYELMKAIRQFEPLTNRPPKRLSFFRKLDSTAKSGIPLDLNLLIDSSGHFQLDKLDSTDSDSLLNYIEHYIEHAELKHRS